MPGYYKMLGSISRQVPRLFRQPGSVIFRRCLAAEAAQGGPAMALTFGSPSEVERFIVGNVGARLVCISNTVPYKLSNTVAYKFSI